MTTPLYADNDFGGTISLETITPSTSAVAPLIAGTVRGIIALLETSDTPAIPALDVALAYVGDQVGFAPGDWSYFFDGVGLSRAALDALATTTLYLVIAKSGDLRVTAKLRYHRTKAATVAPA